MSKVWFWISPNAKKNSGGWTASPSHACQTGIAPASAEPTRWLLYILWDSLGSNYHLISSLSDLLTFTKGGPIGFKVPATQPYGSPKSTSLLKISLHKGCRWLSDTKLPTKCEWVWCLEMDLHPTSVPVKGAGFTMTLTKIKQLLKMDVVKQIV